MNKLEKNKNKIDSYNDMVFWDGHSVDGINYKKNKMKNKTEIKEGNVSIYKLDDAYLLKTSKILQWIPEADIQDLKKVLNKLD